MKVNQTAGNIITHKKTPEPLAIVGGTGNQISGSLCSVIGGGYTNTIRSNPDSSILGGCNISRR